MDKSTIPKGGSLGKRKRRMSVSGYRKVKVKKTGSSHFITLRTRRGEWDRESPESVKEDFSRRIVSEKPVAIPSHPTGAIPADPGLQKEALTTEIREIAGYLQAHLGQFITTYLAGRNDPKLVGKWASGAIRPPQSQDWRLRHAYYAAQIVIDAFGDESASAWFYASSSFLDGRAPAEVLREARTPKDFRDVSAAAESFAELSH